jgi:hypothetical protein
MMKKLGMFAFVMALVVVFALPAFAITVQGGKDESVTIGGQLYYDFGFRNVDKDRNAHVNDGMTSPTSGKDRTYFFNGVSTSTTLWFSFNVGAVSGWANLYAFVSPGFYNSYVDNRVLQPSQAYTSWANTSTSGTFANINNTTGWDLVYGTYKFGDFTIQAGKLPALTVVQVPPQMLGYLSETGGHIDGIAYGYVYENKVPALRFNHYVNKMFNYSIQLSYPSVFAENATPGLAPAAGTPMTIGMSSGYTLRESYSQIPRIGARVGINVGPASINPGFGWEQWKWNDITPGWDDTATAWFVRLPVRLTFGPFVALIEGLYGQNLGGATSNQNSMMASESADSMYKRTATGAIMNANTLNYWADFAYTIGPVTPHIYFGQTQYNNDIFKTVPNSDTSSGRTFYGILANYKITPNFWLVPEFSIYDLGHVPGIGVTNYKLGVDWLAGVQFQFKF